MPLPKKETIQMTESEYLDFDDSDEDKWEFFNGVVYAMAGGTPEHNEIKDNLAQTLKNQIDELDKKCSLFSSDQRTKSHISKNDNQYHYPDIVIFCRGEYTREGTTLINPSLIIEVLSESTEANDRGVKWSINKKNPVLKYYILVSQKKRQIEVFYRLSLFEWKYSSIENGEKLYLGEMGLELDFEKIYKGEFAGKVK